MKVTEKQLQVMYRVLEGSLLYYDRPDNNPFGYNRSTRLQILNQILNQQSDEIIDIKEEENE